MNKSIFVELKKARELPESAFKLLTIMILFHSFSPDFDIELFSKQYYAFQITMLTLIFLSFISDFFNRNNEKKHKTEIRDLISNQLVELQDELFTERTSNINDSIEELRKLQRENNKLAAERCLNNLETKIKQLSPFQIQENQADKILERIKQKQN